MRTSDPSRKVDAGNPSYLPYFLLFVLLVFETFRFLVNNNSHGAVLVSRNVENEVFHSTPVIVHKNSIGPEAKESFASSRSKRMSMYLERYKYQPPAHYTNHTERDHQCGLSPDYSTWFNHSYRTRSANAEDLTAYNIFFKDTGKKGSIVEMGAFDGVTESNSYFFDTCLGWDTLLVEGNPSIWKRLVNNRPHAHRFSFAPSCSQKEEMENKTVAFTNIPLTNAALGVDSVKSAYSEGGHKVDVPCGSLTNVLKDIFHGHVRFFSLDVEGAEPLVVRNIDFSEVFIEIMMIETRNNFCQQYCKSRNEFRKVMKDAGYIMFEGMIAKSDIFIHPLSESLQIARTAGYNETSWDKVDLI